MVKVFLCGPAGSGKTLLLDQLKLKVKQCRKIKSITGLTQKVLQECGIRHTRDFYDDDDLFCHIQTRMAEIQTKREEELKNCDFISDSCLINAVTYSYHYLNNRGLEETLGDKLEGYRTATVILLSPVPNIKQSNIQMKLSQKGWEQMKLKYLELLDKYKIPFIDIGTLDLDSRIKQVSEALKGNISNELLLFNVDTMHDINFPFFLNPVKGDQIRIPTIKVFQDHIEQDWTTEEKGKTNRFIDRYGQDRLALLAFDINVRASHVQKLLLGEVRINSKIYNFLGCSSNGLKNRKCFMWKGTVDEVNAILEENGNFFEIKTVSKRLARVGLLFSSVKMTNITVCDSQVIREGDIEHNGKVFSDGCGGIGKELARQLYAQVKETTTFENYVPAVYQIRFQGCKGVLAVDSKIPTKAIKVRPSMEKFKTTLYPNLCVCDCARPYTFGKLNKQFIQLLSGLGVKDEVFEKKLEHYLILLRTMFDDKEAAIMLLQWKGMFDIAQEIIKMPFVDALKNKDIRKSLSEVQQSLVSSVERLNILIPDSRNIFGVCDRTGTLKYGQCFVRITISGVPKTIRGKVVVCKSPSYLLGDVRVLDAVDIADIADGAESLKDMVDCIVYPTQGARPHPDEIAGSDLDGDMFFVCWDETLIPAKTRPPYDYPSASEKLTSSKITRESIISYFAKQNETRKLISKVDKYFNKWADSEGILCQECERLGRLFSRVIDSSKSGETVPIPPALKEPKDITSEKYIWVKMRNNALRFKEDFSEKFIERNQSKIKDHVSESFVNQLVSQPVTNIGEYVKFEFVLKYLMALEVDPDTVVETFLRKYADNINFTLFSVIEKRSAEDMGIPHAIIANALNKSQILSKEDLQSFQMHTSASPWNFYFREQHDDFDWVHLIKALTEQDHTFIVIKLPHQVTMVLQFLERQKLGVKLEVKPGTIYALFFSKHFGYIGKYVVGPLHLLDFTRDTLQIYRQVKPQSFVWLKAQDWAKDTKKSEKVLSEEIVNAISIDLRRFDKRLRSVRNHPLITKEPLIGLEVFAQNVNEAECYFDLVDVNDMLPVDDVKEDDTDEARAAVDFEDIFPKIQHDEDIYSHAELCQLLCIAAESGNPYHFGSVVEHWKQGPLPTDVSGSFIKLLKEMCQMTTPETMPDEMKDVIENLLVQLQKTLDNQPDLILMARILSQLHCDNMARAIVENNAPTLTENEFIDVVSSWENWWYLDSSFAGHILDNLYCTITERYLKSSESEKKNLQLIKYTTHFSRLQGLAIIAEMQTCKQKLTTSYSETRNSSENFLPTDSETSISFLKVDQSEELEQKFVTFYRMSAVSKRPNICQGNYVALARHFDINTKPSYKSYCCVGQIKEVRTVPFSMTVEIAGDMPRILEDCLHTRQTIFWRAEVIGNITTFVRIMKAVNQILSRGINPRQTIVCEHSILMPAIINPGGFIKDTPLYADERFNHVSEVPVPERLSMDGLNEAQNRAVKTAISQNITLIQGPPGTGKTTCACSIINNIHSLKRYNKILVVAETNIAVDNIARRLVKDLIVLRVGTDEGVAPDLREFTLTGQMQKISESVRAKRTTFQDEHGISHRNIRLINEILKSADVVLTTCAGAGDPALESVEFDFILVDEATQTMEPTLLCSLVHGAKHLVMIGDPKQLGPHIIEDQKPSAGLPGLAELSTTMFHRLHESGVIPNICFLDTQHRMHEAIMKFPSECFYDNKLKSGVFRNRPDVNFPWPKRDRPLCFIDISGSHEQRSGTSFYNMQEVKAVEVVVDCLLTENDSKRDQSLTIDDIGVLTTYKAQVKMLRQSVKPKVEISSVDGFQGREKEVIVVSTVRANGNRNLGFSDDRNRINVLLTRAKRGLIVIGNEHTLKSSEIWKRWLKQAPKQRLSDISTTTSSQQ